MSYMPGKYNYTYTTATVQSLLKKRNLEYMRDDFRTEMERLAAQDGNVTFISRKFHNPATRRPDNQYFPAMFANPKVQAPWLPAMEADKTLVKAEGEIERGRLPIDIEPGNFVTRTVPEMLVMDNAVLEDPNSITDSDGEARDVEGVLKGNARITSKARLGNKFNIAGDTVIGGAFVSEVDIKGCVDITGGASVLDCDLDGNIVIKGQMRFFRKHVRGNVTIACRAPEDATWVHAVRTPDHAPFINNGFMTLQRSHLKDCLNSSRSSSFEEMWDNMHQHIEENLVFDTFCLDTVNHREFCRCGLYFPAYLAGVPAAIQYYGLVDTRKPAQLQDDVILSLLNSYDVETAIRAEVLSGTRGKCPTSYDAWCAMMVNKTGVHPDTYLVN